MHLNALMMARFLIASYPCPWLVSMKHENAHNGASPFRFNKKSDHIVNPIKYNNGSQETFSGPPSPNLHLQLVGKQWFYFCTKPQ